MSTNFFVVPSTVEQITAKSGTVYTPVNNIITNVATGDVLDVINSGARQVGGPDSNATQPWVASRFYTGLKGLTPTTILSVANTIYAYPFRCPGNVPVQTMSADVTTGQTAGAFRMALYADLNGAPNALVSGSDSGQQIATSGAGVITFTPASPLVLNEGWYWAALVAYASGTYPTFAGITANASVELSAGLGFDTAAHAFATSGEFLGGVSAAFTFGSSGAAMPATFPTASYALSLGAPVPMLALGT